MEKIKILMCGSELSVKGGIVSVIKNYLDYPSWDEFEIKYIPTHTENNKIVVILYFFLAYIKLVFNSVFGNCKIVYLHTAERGSFYRKSIIVRTLRLFGIKTVMHHHAAEFEEFYAKQSPKRKEYINKTLELADRNIVLSKKLISMITDKSPNAKVEVLYNAVNVPAKNPYNPDAKNVLFLGRLGHRKGTYDLLHVIKKLDVEISKDIQFYLCGDGEIEAVKDKIKEYGIDHRIAHVGWIDGEMKKNFIHNSMLNVLPSYNEGLPMTILETMANGIPNISTNIASIPEVIEDGVTGYMIEPGNIQDLYNIMKMCISNNNLRKLLSKNSYEMIVKKFSLGASINELKVYLHDILNGENQK